MKQKIIKLFKLALSYLPTKLPVGLTEMQQFCNEIIELSGKYADEDSMKYVITTSILHLDPSVDRISKQFFMRKLRKAAANQVASAVFTDIRDRNKPVEATTKPQVLDVAPNEQKAK